MHYFVYFSSSQVHHSLCTIAWISSRQKFTMCFILDYEDRKTEWSVYWNPYLIKRSKRHILQTTTFFLSPLRYWYNFIETRRRQELLNFQHAVLSTEFFVQFLCTYSGILQPEHLHIHAYPHYRNSATLWVTDNMTSFADGETMELNACPITDNGENEEGLCRENWRVD